jgi:hypothetical protein
MGFDVILKLGNQSSSFLNVDKLNKIIIILLKLKRIPHKAHQEKSFPDASEFVA